LPDLRKYEILWSPPLTGKPNSRVLQIEVAYWPALAVGGTAQLVAAQKNGIWTHSSS